MRAIRVNGWGQPLQLEDISVPVPGNDEVLVRVRAASINPFDIFIHAGYLQGMVNVPLTLGTDFSGEVAEVGSGITHVMPGDAVYGLVPMHSGSFAEYLVAGANEVTHKPRTLDFAQAAGVPLPSLAGYQTLIDIGQAKKGERVLIIGAAGAVGGTAVQLAKELGLHVIAVDIPEKADFVRELGADEFVDAKNQRYEDHAGTVDLVLDYVGGENTTRSYNILQPGGRYVTSMVLEPPQEEAKQRGIRSMGLGTQPRVDELDEISRKIDENRLKTFVNCTFPLEQAQEAMEYRSKTTAPGKIVLLVA